MLAEIVGSNSAQGMDVFCACCVLLGRGPCDGLVSRPEKSYRVWCVVVRGLGTSETRRPWPTLGRSATEIKNYNLKIQLLLPREDRISSLLKTSQINVVWAGNRCEQNTVSLNIKDEAQTALFKDPVRTAQ